MFNNKIDNQEAKKRKKKILPKLGNTIFKRKMKNITKNTLLLSLTK